jgi:hypothetical protein
MTKRLTLGVMAAAIVALIGYDIWVYVEPTEGDTISEITLWIGRRWSVLPFGFGVLGGHFFLPRKHEPFGWPRRRSVLVLAALGAAVLARDLVAFLLPHSIHPAAPFGFGVLMGGCFWGQAEKEDPRGIS